MSTVSRRTVLGGIAVAAASGTLARPAWAAEKVVRIGYQKYGNFLLLKTRRLAEAKLEPLGWRVEWREFPGGPQLLEALNVGAIDLGVAGETPPIFAQAAGAPLVYLAHEPPAPLSEAILVLKDSPIRDVAELKGKRVALNKGSNVHYLLVRALEKAGLRYSDIQPVFLAPADGRAAFEARAVDAWVIWDPFQAAAELAVGARTLASGEGLVSNHQFYLGHRKFVTEEREALEIVLAAIEQIDRQVSGTTDDAARELAAAIGMPEPVLKLALSRQAWGVRPLGDAVVAEQQRIADTFLALGLIPKPIKVADAVRRPIS